MATGTPFKTPLFYRLAGVLALGLVLGVLSFVMWPKEGNGLAAQRYAQSLARVPAQQNAYFAILGLGASGELDPVVVAQRIMADVLASNPREYQTNHYPETDHTPHFFDTAPYFGLARHPTRDRTNRYCREPKFTPDCLKAALERRAEVAQRLVQERVFVQRVVALRKAQTFEEPVLGDLLLDTRAYRTLSDLNDLLNAGTVINMETPALRDAALLGLEQDVLLWTRFLNQAGSPVSRWLHHHYLVQKYRLMSALIRRHPGIVSEHRDVVARITQPLTAQTTPLKPRLDAEFPRKDLWGTTRLLELQRQIALAQVPAASVAQFVADAGPALADPHTKLPMHYDAKSHSISFLPESKGVEKEGSNRVSL